MTAPALFLDIDGVIAPYYRDSGGVWQSQIRAECAEIVVRLVQKFDCDVVVVSSWRWQLEEAVLLAKLAVHGINSRVSLAPIVGDRASDVDAWLAEHSPRAFVILDDDRDDELEEFGDRHIKPRPTRGLGEIEYEAAALALGCTCG